MSYNIICVCRWRIVIAALFAIGIPIAQASNGPLLSGSYEVVRHTTVGSQAEIQMRILLVNHGASNLSIQRMTLWDFSHPEKGGSRACAVTVRAHAAAETTQEFTLPRSDYQLWKKGFRPRFVLQMTGPANTKSKAVVRLDRISGQEAK